MTWADGPWVQFFFFISYCDLGIGLWWLWIWQYLWWLSTLTFPSPFSAFFYNLMMKGTLDFFEGNVHIILYLNFWFVCEMTSQCVKDIDSCHAFSEHFFSLVPISWKKNTYLGISLSSTADILGALQIHSVFLIQLQYTVIINQGWKRILSQGQNKLTDLLTLKKKYAKQLLHIT